MYIYIFTEIRDPWYVRPLCEAAASHGRAVSDGGRFWLAASPLPGVLLPRLTPGRGKPIQLHVVALLLSFRLRHRAALVVPLDAVVLDSVDQAATSVRPPDDDDFHQHGRAAEQALTAAEQKQLQAEREAKQQIAPSIGDEQLFISVKQDLLYIIHLYIRSITLTALSR